MKRLPFHGPKGRVKPFNKVARLTKAIVNRLAFAYLYFMRTLFAHPKCAFGCLAMKHAYDHTAPKKPTNLSINSDLLAKSKTLGLNLSATLENALADEVRKAERAQWLERNQKAIDASNRLAQEQGLFADAYRTI